MRRQMGKRVFSLLMAVVMVLSMMPMPVFAAESTDDVQNPFAGKTVSILGDSISTYSGTTNNTHYNETLGKNIGFYPVNDVTSQGETWWQQVIDVLGMELCVNNSSGGGRILSDEKLSVISNGTFTSSARNTAAYKERCVNLHDARGEKPDVIWIFLGTNDFSYHLDSDNCEACKALAACPVCQGSNTCQSCVASSGLNPSFCTQALGTAEISANLISQNENGTYSYMTPQTTCEAYAIMLHKIGQMYPDAEVFCMGLLARRNPDYTGGYHDHGQPTAFNGEIKKIAEQFGAVFVDLEHCGIDKAPSVFDQYIYDKAVHPNAAGMDKITGAVISAMLGSTSELYEVSVDVTNAQFDGKSAAIGGISYSAKLTPAAGFADLDVTVTMGGEDITADAYANGLITVPCVTGDVMITAAGTGRQPMSFRWVFDGSGLVSEGEEENELKKIAGTVTNGQFSNVRYQLDKAIVLSHDRSWVLEWKGEGDGGFMLAKEGKTNDGNNYFFHRANHTLEAFGYWNKEESMNHNYGVCLKDLIDDGSHTYRLENRISADGSNMVYLIVDDRQLYRLDGFFHGGTAQNTTDNWVSGQDFVFHYIGTQELPLTDYRLDYLEIHEDAHTAHTYQNGSCTVCSEVEPTPTFTTVDAMVTAIRKAMIQRQPQIQVRLNGAALTTSDASDLFRQATAHTGVPNEGDYIRANMTGYSTAVTTGEDSGGVYSIVTINCSFISDAAMEAEVDAAVEELLNELDLWDSSNYEKVKGVYDWITENVAYDFDWDDLAENTNYYQHTTHAALIAQKAVCQGYASLYYRLMLELGVDCRYISGFSTDITGTERHGWNIVYLDGKYYNCDPTWDRSLMGHYRHFLCTPANFAEHERDEEYDTPEFHAQYPMAITPYVQNVTASGKINANLAWVLDGDTGTLTVAGTGAIPSYRFSRAPWYDYRESVQKIVISEGITEVGERAFYWCTNCTEVLLPDSLLAIREYGFDNLRSMQSITLPSKLQTIEFCAFSECVALKSITLPDSVTTVGPSAFSNCPNLTRARLSAGMKTVPSSMFGNDSSLSTVILPEGITYIDDTAFINCGFASFTLPASVTGLGTAVFSGCTVLSQFIVEESNPKYKAVDGVLFSADGTHLVCFPSGKYGNYTVPEGTRYIDYGAFRSTQYLYRVYFPSTLTEIGGYAFSYCRNLSAVTFNSNIQTIGEDAFRSCTSLRTVNFQNPNVNLVGYTFAGCTSLQSITLPANLREIPNGLFYSCTNLQSITIPRTATRIGSSAFLDCDGLTSVNIPGSVKSIGQQAFDFCNRLETITFEEGVQTLGWISIRNAPRLKKVVIPKSVTKIEHPYSSTDSYMFDGCPNVVLYVECGTYGQQYAVSRGLKYQLSHAVYAASVVSPTCTAQGYTHYRCSCSVYDYHANYVPALGHDYTVLTVPSSCTEDGFTRYTCLNCGYTYENELVPAAHDYGAWYIAAEATCTEEGEKRRDCHNCDHHETMAIPALGHTEVADAAVAPTCTAAGLAAGKHCSVCSEVLVKQEVIPATGHTEVIDEAVAPTCTATGLTAGKHCSVCGEVLVKQEVIPATGHTEVIDNAVAPTCTAAGLTAGKHCGVCGEVLVKQEVIPATGHTEVIDNAVAPTCTAAGLTAGKHCGVCGEVLAKQNVIPALGHSYESGSCTVCGAADPDFRIAVEVVGEIDYAVSGSMVTVTHDTACKVGYLVDGAYVKIDATSNPDGSYSFTAPEGVSEVLVVISGDVNGDGKILAADKSRLNAALLKKTTLSAKEIFAADVNDDGKLLAADKSRLNAVLLKKTTLTW